LDSIFNNPLDADNLVRLITAAIAVITAGLSKVKESETGTNQGGAS